MKNKIILIALTLAGVPALADQCTWLTAAQAEIASDVFYKAENVQTFCEPCGDKQAQDVAAESIEVVSVKDSALFQIMAGKQPLDLAYTFINGYNVASLVGCKANGVSEKIK